MLLIRCIMRSIKHYYPGDLIIRKSRCFCCISYLFSASNCYFLHQSWSLACFIKNLIKSFLNYVIFSESFLVNSHNLLQKQLLNVFFGCKNRVCHHNFKLDAESNGWTKNEAKTFSRKSVISRKIHWLDNVRQSSS